MTDRVKGLVVLFDKAIRDDDAQCIVNAIEMIKGVRKVKTSIRNSEEWLIKSDVRLKLRDKLLEALKEE